MALKDHPANVNSSLSAMHSGHSLVVLSLNITLFTVPLPESNVKMYRPIVPVHIEEEETPCIESLFMS